MCGGLRTLPGARKHSTCDRVLPSWTSACPGEARRAPTGQPGDREARGTRRGSSLLTSSWAPFGRHRNCQGRHHPRGPDREQTTPACTSACNPTPHAGPLPPPPRRLPQTSFPCKEQLDPKTCVIALEPRDWSCCLTSNHQKHINK